MLVKEKEKKKKLPTNAYAMIVNVTVVSFFLASNHLFSFYSFVYLFLQTLRKIISLIMYGIVRRADHQLLLFYKQINPIVAWLATLTSRVHTDTEHRFDVVACSIQTGCRRSHIFGRVDQSEFLGSDPYQRAEKKTSFLDPVANYFL